MSSFLQPCQTAYQKRITKIVQCPICLDTLCLPVTTPCGHNFCVLCLDHSLRKQKNCPICRSVCSFSASELVENKVLSEICESLNPEKYATKALQLRMQIQEWKSNLPIFFYNSYEFPGTMISLHLFEARYKLMIKRITHTSRKFVFLPSFTSYTANKNDVGLLCELKECQILADGRAMLTAKCIHRIKIIDNWVENGTQGLHYCKCEEYNDFVLEGEQLTAVQEMRLQVSNHLAKHHSEAIKGFMAHHGKEPDNDVGFSFWASNFLNMKLQKANYLTQSTFDRMQVVYATVIGHSYNTSMVKVNNTRNTEQNTIPEHNNDTSMNCNDKIIDDLQCLHNTGY